MQIKPPKWHAAGRGFDRHESRRTVIADHELVLNSRVRRSVLENIVEGFEVRKNGEFIGLVWCTPTRKLQYLDFERQRNRFDWHRLDARGKLIDGTAGGGSKLYTIYAMLWADEQYWKKKRGPAVKAAEKEDLAALASIKL